MSEDFKFKFEPKPPIFSPMTHWDGEKWIIRDLTWKDTIRLIYRKEGKPADDAERDICELMDMSKEDAIINLTNRLAEIIL